MGQYKILAASLFTNIKFIILVKSTLANMAAETEALYQFKFHLVGISPMIWRKFIVRADTTMAELHYIVQHVMGWSDTHLNCLKIYGKNYGVSHIGGMMFSDHPMKVCLKDLNPLLNGAANA